MKLHIIGSLLTGLFVAAAGAQDKPDLKTDKEKVSYAIGAQIGGGMKQQELEVDIKALLAGLTDSLTGKVAMTEVEMSETMAAFQKQMMARESTRQKEAGDKNLKEGEAFLAENAKKPGFKVLPSGLQYKVLKSGAGKSPKTTDTVKAHYRGTLIDGTVFDSSIDRGEPATFALNQVIPGWIEALQLMKEGDKWQLVIPAKLAYGPRPAGPKIGPNSTLIFEVELLSVEKSQ